MELTASTLASYEAFLGSLRLQPELFRIRNFEQDLYDILNPAAILDQLFFRDGRWMGFEDFFNYYTGLHQEEVRRRYGFNSYEDFLPGLKARLYRTQFGLLTEYHAYHLCKDFFGQDNVRRSMNQDRTGVDFQLRINGAVYNIHIFIDTPRSWAYRRFKSRKKSADSAGGIHVNLPYSKMRGRFNSLRFLENGFGVYTGDYLRYFGNEAVAGRILDGNIVGTTDAGFIYRQQAG